MDKEMIYNEKDDKFRELTLNKDKIDGRLIAINSNYLAMSWKYGDIVLVNSSNPCKIKKDEPRIKYTNNKLNDIEFSPFNNKIIASAYDDSCVLWKIPDGELKENITKELQIYKKHTKKVNYITFNPIVDNLLCSGTIGGEIHIWNPEKIDNYIEFKSDDNPTMISWNSSGDLVGVTTKNKLINIFDPRNNKMILRQLISEDYVSPKFGWIDNNLFVTTGYDKAKKGKMLKLWDIRKQNNNSLNEGEITSIKINDSKADIFTPFINKKLKIIYAIGKEKSSITAYNYSEEKFSKIKDYKSTASICTVLLDRKYLDKTKTEIDRFANVIKGYKEIYYSSFSLPKNSKIINNCNLFPDENIIVSYEEWIKGKKLENNDDNKKIVNKNNNNDNNQNENFDELNKKYLEIKDKCEELNKLYLEEKNKNKKLNEEKNINDKLNEELKQKYEKEIKDLKQKNEEEKKNLKKELKEEKDKNQKLITENEKYLKEKKDNENLYKTLENKLKEEEDKNKKLNINNDKNLEEKNKFDELNIKYEQLLLIV